MGDGIDKTGLKRLQEDMSAKLDAYNGVEARRRDRERELTKELNARLDAEYGAEMKAAWDARREAEELCRREADRVREAESMASLPWPVGTRLVGWNLPRGYSPDQRMTRTGETAVLEVYKEGDPLPGNTRWDRPSPGQVVLRPLKKDGTPGAKARCWNAYGMAKRWYAEGTDPNAAKG